MRADQRTDIANCVASWISEAVNRATPGHVPLLFLSGAQGSGKSTALEEAASGLDLPIATASIDDVYLPAAARSSLAASVSPLLATRGPPGTHDLKLLGALISQLRCAAPGATTQIPVFDKLADDRAPPNRRRSFTGRPAAIVIEGWLMGALHDPNAPAAPPMNAVETEDAAGIWRRYQEEALASDYAALWDQADSFLHILAPGFETVLAWRLQQEEALWQRRGNPMPHERRAWVARFIQHYERITRRMLAGQRRPGTDLHVDAQRRVVGAHRSG